MFKSIKFIRITASGETWKKTSFGNSWFWNMDLIKEKDSVSLSWGLLTWEAPVSPAHLTFRDFRWIKIVSSCQKQLRDNDWVFFSAWKHLQIMIVSSNTGAFIKVPFMDWTTSLVRNCSHCEIVFSFWSHSWIENPQPCLPFRLVVFYEHHKTVAVITACTVDGEIYKQPLVSLPVIVKTFSLHTDTPTESNCSHHVISRHLSLINRKQWAVHQFPIQYNIILL